MAAWALYFGLLIGRIILAVRYARVHPDAEWAVGAVSVMQPILSGDPLLAAALAQNLATAPAGTTFLWLVDEDDMAGRQLTVELASKSPCAVRIVVCPPCGEGMNPKTAKLQQGLGQVETEYVAVLDDDTVLDADNLARAVAALAECELYTGIPCYAPGVDIWSSLVTHFVNNNSILTYLPVLNLLPPLTINGMFYVLRMDTLKRYGGFTPVLDKLCDDYALAQLVRQHGGRIRQGTTPVMLRTTVGSRARYIALMQRWFVFAEVLVRDQRPAVAPLLVVLLGVPPLLLWLGLLAIFGGVLGVAVLVAAVLARHLLLRLVQRAVFGFFPAMSLPLSLAAELLQPLHLVHATFQKTVRWRSRTIRLRRDGGFSYIERS